MTDAGGKAAGAAFGTRPRWEPTKPRLRPAVAARCLVDQRGLRLRGGGDRARRRPQGLLGRVPGRRGDRRGQRVPAAAGGLAAAAVHARARLRLRAADRRGGAVDRRRRVPGRDRGRVVRGRAARLAGDGRGLDRPRGARRHQRGRRLHPAGGEGHRSPAGRRDPHIDAGAALPGDRRARPTRAAQRDARRQRPEHGPLDRRGRLSPGRMGARPLLADRREPGRDPARLQRGHPGLSLGGEGDRHADDAARHPTTAPRSSVAMPPATGCSSTAAPAVATCSPARRTR